MEELALKGMCRNPSQNSKSKNSQEYFPLFDPPLPKSVADAIPAWAQGFCTRGRAGSSERKAELTHCPTSAAIQAQPYQLVKGRRILPRIVLSRVGVSQAPRTREMKQNMGIWELVMSARR